MKTKVAIFPNFEFEVAISTFIDHSRYEIIPLDLNSRKFSCRDINLVGEWCHPIKLNIAMCEHAVREYKVKKIIALNPFACKQPLASSKMNDWIKEKFDYYPIDFENLRISPMFIFRMARQLKKFDHRINFFRFAVRLPSAFYRVFLAERLFDEYLRVLPLAVNPLALKNLFLKVRLQLLKNSSARKSKAVARKFMLEAESLIDPKKKVKHRVLLSGDGAIILTRNMPVIDISLALSKFGIQVIQPLRALNSYQTLSFSIFQRQARDLVESFFIDRRSNLKYLYLTELMMLTQIFKGFKQGVSGIIYIRPAICSPGENVSFFLKKKKHFKLPFVEIGYDEHTGANGVITRLEAFVNILEESHKSQ